MRRIVLSIIVAVAFAVLGAKAQESVMYTVPAPGDVTELSVIYLHFNGEWTRGSNLSAKITLTGPDGVEIPKIRNYSNGQSVEICFDGNAVLTELGEYVLTIPAGKYAVNDVDIETTTFTYNIVEAVPESISVTPAPGIVNKLDLFCLSFNGVWSLGTNADAEITVTAPEGVELPKLDCTAEAGEYFIAFDGNVAITTPGEYILTIPAGKFAIDEVDNDVTTFVYTIATPEVEAFPKSVADPSPGSYKTIDHGFKVTFDSETPIAVDPDGVSLTGPNGNIDFYMEVPRNMSYLTILPLNDEGVFAPLDRAGNYCLTFSAGSVTIGSISNGAPIVFEYTLRGIAIGDWTGQVTANPADGAVVDVLKDILIAFDGAKTVRVDEFATSEILPMLYNADNGKEVMRSTVYAEDNKLDVSLYTDVDDAGSYRLFIPKELITVDGEKVDHDIELHYTIAAKPDKFEYSYIFTPAEGSLIGFDSPVAITFEAEGLSEVQNDSYAWGETAPRFTNAMKAYNPELRIVKDGNTVTFVHEWPFEQEGEYTLIIPSGYFHLFNTDGDDVKVQRIEAMFHVGISSIEAVDVDAPARCIYTLKGIKVDGPSLNPGIYIIDGKKVKVSGL